MSDDTRFRIGDGATIYSLASVDELSLLDLLALRAELKEIGIVETWQDITAAVEEMEGLENPDDHELSLLVFAVTLWAARRKAGDQLRFAEATNVPMTSIKWLPKPADRQATKSPGKSQSRAKKKARPASARPSAAAVAEDAPGDSTSTD